MDNAEKEVAFKLGWWIEERNGVKWTIDTQSNQPRHGYPYPEEVAAYNLCVSQARELATLRERVKELEDQRLADVLHSGEPGNAKLYVDGKLVSAKEEEKL